MDKGESVEIDTGCVELPENENERSISILGSYVSTGYVYHPLVPTLWYKNIHSTLFVWNKNIRTRIQLTEDSICVPLASPRTALHACVCHHGQLAESCEFFS